jgi:GNAT superfamily N-acetyltransferase
VCFYVSEQFRGKGLMAELLRKAVECARDNGARVVEAYPVDPRVQGAFDHTGFMGVISAFEAAGFQPAPKAGRLVMQGYTDGNQLMRFYIAARAE